MRRGDAPSRCTCDPAPTAPASSNRHGAVPCTAGVVFDSVANAPPADADVQVLGEGTASSYDARTDSLGRFAVERVEAGTYLVG